MTGTSWSAVPEEAYRKFLEDMRDIPNLDHMVPPVPVKVLRFLVESALETLAKDTKPHNPDECGPCWSLQELLHDGVLDVVVSESGSGAVWWDERNKVVDRVWLAEHWMDDGCE